MNALFTILKATVKNLVRDKILYNALFVALFLLAIGYFASLLVYGHQDRVMLHFGLMINAFAVLVIAITAGSRIVTQESESRLLYLILSKPISRPQYWLGKFLGLVFFLLLNLILLSAILLGGIKLTGGEITPDFLKAFLEQVLLLGAEASMMAAFSLMLSLFLTPALSSMLAMTYLFISHNHEQISYLKEQKALGASVFNGLSFIFPRSEQFMLDTRVYYQLPLTVIEWASRMGYGLIWVLIFILVGNAAFYRKNL